MGTYSIWAFELPQQDTLSHYIGFCEGITCIEIKHRSFRSNRAIELVEKESRNVVALFELDPNRNLWALESTSKFGIAFHWLLRLYGGYCAGHPKDTGCRCSMQVQGIETDDKMIGLNDAEVSHRTVSDSNELSVTVLESRAGTSSVVLELKGSQQIRFKEAGANLGDQPMRTNTTLLSPCVPSATSICYHDLLMYR
jgi:hypothetical protein